MAVRSHTVQIFDHPFPFGAPTMNRFGIYFRATLLIALLASLSANYASAANWIEADDGDLSGDYQNPTEINLDLGVNTIRATSGATTSLDLEYFRLNLPAQGQIDAIILRAFETLFDGTAFIGVQEGTSFSFPADEANMKVGELLGWSHFGLFEGGIDGDILPGMGTNFGAIGFTGPLTGSSYTFWTQQQGMEITYELDFVVSAVPEPASAMAALSAIALCGMRRRRV